MNIKISNPLIMSVGTALIFYVLLQFIIKPPLPSSIIWMYMVTLIFAIILYVSYSEKIFKEFLYPIKVFLKHDSFKIPRMSFGIIMPLVFGWISYAMVSPKYDPPAELRTTHPTPPAKIEFNHQQLELAEIRNPFREPGLIESAKLEGRDIYFANCMPCHGANLDAKGHWTQRLFPIPISFRDPGSIAMMPESYIFWRVAKGGIGLPAEGTPWKSTMPPFEKDLSENDIWKVILFIYEETGYVPKSFE